MLLKGIGCSPLSSVEAGLREAGGGRLRRSLPAPRVHALGEGRRELMSVESLPLPGTEEPSSGVTLGTRPQREQSRDSKLNLPVSQARFLSMVPHFFVNMYSIFSNISNENVQTYNTCERVVP